MEKPNANQILINYLLNTETRELENLFSIVDLQIEMGSGEFLDDLSETFDRMLGSESANELQKAFDAAQAASGTYILEYEIDTRELAQFVLREYEARHLR